MLGGLALTVGLTGTRRGREGSRIMRRPSLAFAAAFVALIAAAAQAAQTTYRVENVRTATQRAAVARTGAAIVEVDHGSVTVTASRSDLRALRRAGFKVVSTARKTDFPPADSAYHNYTEMSQRDRLAVATANPRSSAASASAPPTRAATLWAVKISDNVATDETEPEVLFTCGQHAREHLTIEMCLYLLNELTSKYATDAPHHGPRQQPRDLDRPQRQPGRRGVRHRDRLLPLVAQEPPAQHGSSAVGTDLNRNWSFQWGCCGGSSGTFSSETYRGAVARSRRPRPQRVRDFVNSRVVGGVQQIKAAHRLPHLLRADPVAVRLHDREHGARR